MLSAGGDVSPLVPLRLPMVWMLAYCGDIGRRSLAAMFGPTVDVRSGRDRTTGANLTNWSTMPVHMFISRPSGDLGEQGNHGFVPLRSHSCRLGRDDARIRNR